MSFIEEIFKLLSDNKGFPYYQAERRIDIFINIFLEEILKQQLNSDSIEYVLPELALKKKENNQSTKVDYLCFDKQKKILIFIELKTDKNSFSEKQLDTYLSYNTWAACQNDINEITDSPSSKYKPKFEKFKSRLDQKNLRAQEAGDFQIVIVYLTRENPKILEAVKSRGCEDRVFVIPFESLKEFHSDKYPSEWQFLYETVLNTK